MYTIWSDLNYVNNINHYPDDKAFIVDSILVRYHTGGNFHIIQSSGGNVEMSFFLVLFDSYFTNKNAKGGWKSPVGESLHLTGTQITFLKRFDMFFFHINTLKNSTCSKSKLSSVTACYTDYAVQQICKKRSIFSHE